MKKAIYLLALLAIPAFANAQDEAKAKEAKRAGMVAECMDAVKEQATTEESKQAFSDFCSCQVDAVIKNLSLKEIETLENAETADQATQQQLAAKIQPLIMPCVEEMQKKMGAAGGQ